MTRILFVAPAVALLGACTSAPAPSLPAAPLESAASCPRRPVPADSLGGPIYFACQLSTPAGWAPGRAALVYPKMLLSANIEGEVLVRFVVDERGVVEPRSVVAKKSSHDGFTMAARQALLAWRATPAVRDGRPVRQVAFHAFHFELGRGSCAPPMLGADSASVCGLGTEHRISLPSSH